jgi:hypothetical protein
MQKNIYKKTVGTLAEFTDWIVSVFKKMQTSKEYQSPQIARLLYCIF